MNVNDYVVKYAVVPFYNGELFGYMVVKAYILNIVTEKDNNKDNYSTNYIVSYPVDNDDFNYQIEIIDNVYNSYDEASIDKMTKNREVINDKVNNSLIDDRKDVYIKSRNNLEDLNNLEKILLGYTKNLKVTSGKIRTRLY